MLRREDVTSELDAHGPANALVVGWAAATNAPPRPAEIDVDMPIGDLTDLPMCDCSRSCRICGR